MSAIKYVCAECGSADVEIENWNRWDIEKQDWVYVSEAGDNWWCPKCETHSREIETLDANENYTPRRDPELGTSELPGAAQCSQE